jgi:hypothetical protein
MMVSRLALIVAILGASCTTVTPRVWVPEDRPVPDAVVNRVPLPSCGFDRNDADTFAVRRCFIDAWVERRTAEMVLLLSIPGDERRAVQIIRITPAHVIEIIHGDPTGTDWQFEECRQLDHGSGPGIAFSNCTTLRRL